MGASDIISIFNEIKAFFKRQSSLNKSLKKDCEQIMDDRYDKQMQTMEQLQNNLFEQYIGPEEDKTILNNYIQNTSSQNIDNPHIEMGASNIVLKVKARFELLAKQIDGYDKNIDLYSQLNQEKQHLLNQINKDSDQLIQIWFVSQIKQLETQFTPEQLEKMKQYDTMNQQQLDQIIVDVKNILLQSADDLMSALIQRVSIAK